MFLPFAFDFLMLYFYPLEAAAEASVEFALPVAFPSISQVYGQALGELPFFPLYAAPDMGQLTAPFLLLFLGIHSYVTAGYLGALEMTRLWGSPGRFFKSANVYFSRVFAFDALIAVILLVLEPFIMDTSSGLLLSLFILSALLLIIYFLFLTPFCVVVDDCALGMAFRKSVKMVSQAWKEVLSYCLAYAAITILASAAVILLLDLPFVGAPLSIGLYGLLGTALVASTLHLYDGLQPKEALPLPTPRPKVAEEVVPT
ncbi:MAG: hypothetical protein LN412_01235 [Candidatus Thermoplasmatota archaeon]|nr:hypothetical protein [Candidatus Thermoplasmatota archaeon]